MFSCEFSEIFKNTFFIERLETTASVNKINLLQKRSVSIVLNEGFRSKENFAQSHAKSLFRKLNVFNIFQINIYQHLTLMHRFNNIQVPNTFYDKTKQLPMIPNDVFFSSNSFYIKSNP